MSTFDKQSYNNAYNKSVYIGVSFRVNKQTEAHIVQALKAQPNIKEYICRLIMADIRKRERKAGWTFNRGDRKVHADYQRYPFEVVENLANNDRYTVGFAESLDSAHALVAAYMQRTPNAGTIHIYHRLYDPDLRCVCAVSVMEG